MPLSLHSKTRLLFIGDSITDCSRQADVEEIGSGYVRIVRDYLRARDPASAPIVSNRGISGHKVTDLAARWQRDVIDLGPGVLSIKIGINDVWHALGGRSGGVCINDFVPIYRDILRQTRKALPACELVLCEPSVIWPPQPEEGNDLLQPYIQAVRSLAKEFGIEYVVPLSSAFARAREERPDIHWAPDGVHPSSSGHMLIARTWLITTGLL